jgi:hypothetical protein
MYKHEIFDGMYVWHGSEAKIIRLDPEAPEHSVIVEGMNEDGDLYLETEKLWNLKPHPHNKYLTGRKL